MAAADELHDATPEEIPVIDVSALVDPGASEGRRMEAARAIHRACVDVGFFYAAQHGVPQPLIDAVMQSAARFFALPAEQKAEIAMAKAGRYWRGWFPVGDELTSGKPDLKEGLYFGQELPEDHPAVAEQRLPMHGPNSWPAQTPELRPLVTEYMDRVVALGHSLMVGVALGLGRPADFFRDAFRGEFAPFRIFHYPPSSTAPDSEWGVGEHRDYGVATLLMQDDVGGLEVRLRDGRWVRAPPIPGTFVVNIGDMLERWTGGLYQATPHRVRNTTGRERFSLPLFFDPSFDAEIRPMLSTSDSTASSEPPIIYGDYIVSKVAKCFPELFASSRL